MPENEIEVQQYQWIKGDHQGKVETFVETEGKFLVFESGRRCNKSVLKEFMMKIDMDNTALQFDDPLQKVTKSTPKKKAIEKKMPELKKAIVESRLPLPQSPAIPLIEKAKKTKTKLNVRMNCDLPNKAFIKVLEESFDEDVINDLAEFLVSKIEDPKQYLIDCMKGSILEWYKYNNKTTKK